MADLDPTLDYNNLFTRLAAPCMVLDRQMMFVEMNDAYLETVQRSRAELLRRFVFDAFPEEVERRDRFEAAFQKALDGEANALVEVPFSIPLPAEQGGGFTEIWWTCHHTPVEASDGTVAFMVQHAQDVTDRVQAQRLKDTIAAELQHRVGNLLTLVSTIARRTAQNSDNLDDFVKRFEGRIHSLARTHSELGGDGWEGMTFRQLLDRQLDLFEGRYETRIAVEGDDLALSSEEAQSISMAVHELSTNAVKYGALRGANGHLSVRLKKHGVDGYLFEWREAFDVPDTEAEVLVEPAKLGFGSMLLTKILPSQLDGKAERQFTSTGHLYRLTVSKRKKPLH